MKELSLMDFFSQHLKKKLKINRKFAIGGTKHKRISKSVKGMVNISISADRKLLENMPRTPGFGDSLWCLE